MLNALLDFFYPPKCVLCGHLLKTGEETVCDPCGRLLLSQAIQEKRDESFSVCISPFIYDGLVRDSIHRYKFGGREHYAAAFGNWLAAAVRERLSGQFDLISWVPVGRRRRRERGYDQALLLASHTAKALNMPLVRTLMKIRNNPAQSMTRSTAERRDNVKNVYLPYHPEHYQNGRILIIDDVMTTGATLTECCRVLHAAGVARVVCATLAAVSIR